MPVRYAIDPDLGITVIVCLGEITGAEILDAADKICVDARRRPGMCHIVDMKFGMDATNFVDLKRAAALARETVRNGIAFEPIAIVTDSKGIGMLLDAFRYMSAVEVMIQSFSTTVDALKWLGKEEAAESIMALLNKLHLSN